MSEAYLLTLLKGNVECFHQRTTVIEERVVAFLFTIPSIYGYVLFLRSYWNKLFYLFGIPQLSKESLLQRLA